MGRCISACRATRCRLRSASVFRGTGAARLLGLAPEPVLTLPLQADVRTPPGLRFHARARVEVDAQGRLSARVLAGQESFRLMSMLQANAWVVLARAVSLPARRCACGLGSSGPGAAGEPGAVMNR